MCFFKSFKQKIYKKIQYFFHILNNCVHTTRIFKIRINNNIFETTRPRTIKLDTFYHQHSVDPLLTEHLVYRSIKRNPIFYGKICILSKVSLGFFFFLIQVGPFYLYKLGIGRSAYREAALLNFVINPITNTKFQQYPVTSESYSN